MPQGFDAAFETVKQLVATFKANEGYFLSPEYQEAEVRKDFIDKFFIALGWDVYHETQQNPYAQEVKVERGVSMGAAQRRADYAFYVAPNFRDARFYAEAKKPYGDIATRENYFQTIRYGWGQTRVAVLTDFQHFHVLDCRYKPNVETAPRRIVKKFHYTDYCDLEKFAELYYLFSHQAVTSGALETYAATLRKARQRLARRTPSSDEPQPLDESFLSDLDNYRLALARAFKSQNQELDSEVLTEVTQRTLDRLVFMRFLEDKLIEPERFVERFGKKQTAWADFRTASERLDGIYNGIVFKKHPVLDAPAFRVDDAAFGGICAELSDTYSPYDFNAIPIYILGAIYERFLGKVVIATDKRARVEEKPEVRKAGGVYYTPEYIVRYIVENTVGKLIEGKTPAQIAEMRFADIACGSGSFLLAVYDTLLQYHGVYYNANPAKARKNDCVTRDGKLYLSLHKKREILLNNIYGVDIDPQAVEVAQLSLYLNLLKEETTASAHEHQLEFHETLLPPLNKNIVCGNSLIGTDILDGQLFDNGDKQKLNPMDFQDGFPEIMKRGGFDAIVSNPPYVRIQGFPQDQIAYLAAHYQSATGNCDLYASFIERGFSLLRKGGRLGEIMPNKFIKTDYGHGLRELIASNRALAQLIDFGASQVFDATIYTCLLFLTRRPNDHFLYAQAEAKPECLISPSLRMIPTSTLGATVWSFANVATSELLQKLSRNTIRLLDFPAQMSRGSSTGDDEVYIFEKARGKIESGILREPIFASDFSRYCFSPCGKWRIVFPYHISGGRCHPYTEQELKNRFPRAFAHLQSKQAALKKRKQFSKWYGFSAPRNLELHDHATIIVPLLANRGSFALIPKERRGKLCPMASGGFTITLADACPLRAEYVLGLLNSRLLFWKLRQISNVFRGGWITCTKQYFGELPIRRINFSDPADTARHDNMVRLVEQLSKYKKKLVAALSDRDTNTYTNICDGLDRRIDGLVYELYGLTPTEIEIVEGTAKAEVTAP